MIRYEKVFNIFNYLIFIYVFREGIIFYVIRIFSIVWFYFQLFVFNKSFNRSRVSLFSDLVVLVLDVIQ